MRLWPSSLVVSVSKASEANLFWTPPGVFPARVSIALAKSKAVEPHTRTRMVRVLELTLAAAACLVCAVRASNEEGKAYLEANKKKEGVVTLTSGLQYKVLRQGSGTHHPTANSPCECHYAGTLIDGTQFDSVRSALPTLSLYLSISLPPSLSLLPSLSYPAHHANTSDGSNERTSGRITLNRRGDGARGAVRRMSSAAPHSLWHVPSDLLLAMHAWIHEWIHEWMNGWAVIRPRIADYLRPEPSDQGLDRGHADDG